MPIYEIRFFGAADAPLLVYVTSSEEPPLVVSGLPAADEIPYTRYEVWRGRECVHAAARG